jgi:hypothetical protein
MSEVVYALTSSCGEFKAEVERRSNGVFEVIPYKWFRDEIPDYGTEEFWQEVRYSSSFTGTLDRAIELAHEKIRGLGGTA